MPRTTMPKTTRPTRPTRTTGDEEGEEGEDKEDKDDSVGIGIINGEACTRNLS
jgi:hypothetical protein